MVYNEMDPKEAIEAWLNSMSEVNKRWTFLDKHGLWRDTEQTDQVAEIGTELVSTIEPEIGKCYKNSFQAATRSKQAEFVEGLTFVRGGSDPTKHAWVEVDDTVIELTWEHRTELPTPPAESAYYGHTISSDDLTELAFELDHSGPFIPHIVE